MKYQIKTENELSIFYGNVIIGLDLSKPKLITVEDLKNNRSLAINKLYWMWISEIRNHIKNVSGRIYVSDAIHEMLKEMFLTPKVYEFRGKVIKKYSSKNLSNKDFTVYLNDIDMYSANDLSLILKKPEDLFNEAMGRK